MTYKEMDAATQERFWVKVDKHGPGGCWLWIGVRNSCGYGSFSYRRDMWGAARVAWSLVNGEIGGGLHVLHRCDVRHCVNPAHLFLGTNADNVADRNAKGRQHRPRGELHPQAKLTASDVASIRSSHAAGGISHASLARRFGVGETAVRDIVHRRRWRDLEATNGAA